MAKSKEKPVSTWRALLALLMAFILPACASNPYGTYDEATEAWHKTKDPAALEAIERFEAMVEKAEKYFYVRELCFADSGDQYIWVCNGEEKYNSKRPPLTTDALIRTYRRDRHNCGCTTREAINRALGY